MTPLEVEDFLTWLAAERGRSVNTLAAYRRDLRGYVAWLTDRSVSLADADEPTIASYVAAIRATGQAPASVARALVAVRSLYRFMAQEGYLDVDPTAQIDVPRVPKGLPKPLTEAEVSSLLESVSGKDAIGLRDRAILEVLYGTGLRISELIGLGLADVDVQSGLIRAFGKGAKERMVPVGRFARDALSAYLSPSGREVLVPTQWARRDDAEAVFLNRRGGRLTRQGAWQIVRSHGDRVGLGDRLTPHVLRHSCATHMLDHGADIRAVQELLGHASLSTTQVYTLVSTERLRVVYESAHPRAKAH
ncbi:MAG: site-specific tyrosine recombinase XerD [Actinomycetes bacterium]